MKKEKNVETTKTKGAPGRESRTGTRLVSPTRGHEKKKGTPSSLGSNLGFRIVECARVCQNVAYSIRICKNEPLIKENIKRKN